MDQKIRWKNHRSAHSLHHQSQRTYGSLQGPQDEGNLNRLETRYPSQYKMDSQRMGLQFDQIDR